MDSIAVLLPAIPSSISTLLNMMGSFFKAVSVCLVLAFLVADVQPKPASNPMKCYICKLIVGDLESWLTSDTTEQQIGDWISWTCELVEQLFSPGLASTCNELLHVDFTAIIESLVAGHPPEQVCAYVINACPTKFKTIAVPRPLK